MEAPGVVAVEPPEVDQLAGRVYLGLEGCLGLVQHGGGVDSHPPVPGQQVGAPLEDGAPALQAEIYPGLLGIDCGPTGRLNLLLPSQVDVRQDVSVVVRDHLGGGVSREDQLTVDHAWYLDYLCELSVHLSLERLPLRASWCVSHYRLVHWLTHRPHRGTNHLTLFRRLILGYSHSLGSPFFSFFQVL